MIITYIIFEIFQNIPFIYGIHYACSGEHWVDGLGGRLSRVQGGLQHLCRAPGEDHTGVGGGLRRTSQKL